MAGIQPVGFGPWLWFKLYWVAWALLLAVAARLLIRGRARQGKGGSQCGCASRVIVSRVRRPR